MGVAPHVLKYRLSILTEVTIVAIDIDIKRVFEIVGTEEISQL